MRFFCWKRTYDTNPIRRSEKQLDILPAGDFFLERKPAVIFRELVLRTAVMCPEERSKIGEAALFYSMLAEMREQRRKLGPFPEEELVAHEVK